MNFASIDTLYILLITLDESIFRDQNIGRELVYDYKGNGV